jgi:hypothetical protein
MKMLESSSGTLHRMSRRQWSRAGKMHRIAHQMIAGSKLEIRAPDSRTARWIFELARVLVHPASFCLGCYIFIVGYVVAQALGLGRGRQLEVDAFFSASLIAVSSLLGASRGDRNASIVGAKPGLGGDEGTMLGYHTRVY